MPRAPWWLAVLLMCTVLLQGCSEKSAETPDQTREENEAPETFTESELKEQASSAVEHMIQLLEDKDYRTFTEEYFPEEVLSMYKDDPESLKDVVESFDRNQETVQEFLDFLKQVKKVEPQLDSSQTYATFQVDVSQEPREEKIPTSQPTPQPPAREELLASGFGPEWKSALEAAIQTLREGQFKTFVYKMFPLGELAEQRASGQLETLIKMMKLPTDENSYQTTLDPGELMVGQMLADLKTMTELEPTMEEGGIVAVFTLPGLTYFKGNEKIQLPERTVKLEKVGGNWRFADQGGEVQKTMAELKRIAEESGEKDELVLKRSGKSWRIFETDKL